MLFLLQGSRGEETPAPAPGDTAAVKEVSQEGGQAAPDRLEEKKAEAQAPSAAAVPQAENVPGPSAAAGTEGTTAGEGKETTGTAKETDVESKAVLKVEKTAEDLFSMELRNVEIQDLMRVLAYKYKLNIIMDQEVKGKVTASFSNIPLEEALDVLLENLNLTSEREGTLIKIKPNLVSKTFTLNHVEAKLIYDSLSGQSAGDKKESTLANLVSADGKVFMGGLPNSLLVIDYPSYIRRVAEYIAMVDQKMTSRIFKLKYLNAADIVGAEPEKASGPAKAK